RGTQLMKRRERELHLRLHPHRTHDHHVAGCASRVLEQRRLPNPRLPANHEGPAIPRTRRVEQSVERRALVVPPAQCHLADGRSTASHEEISLSGTSSVVCRTARHCTASPSIELGSANW